MLNPAEKIDAVHRLTSLNLCESIMIVLYSGGDKV